MHFRFWGTCQEHAGLLHRFKHSSVVCCLHSPIIYIWHFSPCYPSSLPTLRCPSPSHPQLAPVCDAPLPVSSLFNTPIWVRTCVFDFLFLCQFAENDGFQICPSPDKGHKLIIFYGCIVFHGIYMPHFLYPVYHRWAFGLILCLCYCELCFNKYTGVCIFIIEWFLFLWVYIQ